MHMSVPLLKEQSLLTPEDFATHPIWVRAKDFDQGQIKQLDETVYRPWDGPLPFEGRSPFSFVLVDAVFRLSCGQSYRGYFTPVREDWDNPLPPRKVKSGQMSEPLRWSSRRGGSPLSILALHTPIIFIHDTPYDFRLRRDLHERKRCIVQFFQEVGAKPHEVFPIEFSSSPAYFRGIVSGRLDGFYAFPLDSPYEIEQGQRYLASPA